VFSALPTQPSWYEVELDKLGGEENAKLYQACDDVIAEDTETPFVTITFEESKTITPFMLPLAAKVYAADNVICETVVPAISAGDVFGSPL